MYFIVRGYLKGNEYNVVFKFQLWYVLVKYTVMSILNGKEYYLFSVHLFFSKNEFNFKTKKNLLWKYEVLILLIIIHKCIV